MKRVTRLLKALSDETRLRIVHLLSRKPLCVCELQYVLELSQPSVSHHLKVLYNAGIVDFNKEGLFVNYCLSAESLGVEGQEVVEAVIRALQREEKALSDLVKIEGVTRDEILSKGA